MVEFKIQLEENVVQSYGYKIIEQQIKDFITHLTVKLAAKDVSEDLKNISLENDEKWAIAREQAWKDSEYSNIYSLTN